MILLSIIIIFLKFIHTGNFNFCLKPWYTCKKCLMYVDHSVAVIDSKIGHPQYRYVFKILK